jgi:hypothetical protein
MRGPIYVDRYAPRLIPLTPIILGVKHVKGTRTVFALYALC